MGAEAKKALPPDCCAEMRTVLDDGPGLVNWEGGDCLGDEVAPGVYIQGCDSCMFIDAAVRFCPFCGKALS